MVFVRTSLNHQGACNGKIPIWLYDIPSKAGDGSDATVVAPSIYLDESADQAQQRAKRRQNQREQPLYPDVSKPQPSRRRTRANPAAAPATITVPKSSPPPAPNTCSLPVRERPRRPPAQINNGHIVPIRSSSPAPSPSRPPPATRQKPTPTATQTNITSLPLRNLIARHFSLSCPICPYISESCPRCETVKRYIMQPRHTGRFLAEYMLPISERLGWDETVAYLNEGIVDRVTEEEGRGERQKKYPVTDDFERVRGVALRRREVLDGDGDEDKGEGEGVMGR
ncbi:hypothetical protein QBC44DRAFT_402043 [Cladorrhinum sp. PSN332]|nr:hypothetical protein QBC44DRAFT_402043 [Cladorrhinum sp. PSN332]